MTEHTHEFQAEVAKLLDIVTHSLYSEKEIFLRELVSNSSDACDRLRYAALTAPELIKDDPEFKVTITIDDKAKTLTIEDNGIGMSEEGCKKLFIDFSKLDENSQRNKQGTGLGLSICKKIIE